MFDDQPINNQNQPPGNLPVGEPEDIFDGTAEDIVQEAPAPVPQSAPKPVEQTPKQLDVEALRDKAAGVSDGEKTTASQAGILKPIMPAQTVQTPKQAMQIEQPSPKMQHEMKESGVGRVIMISVIVIISLTVLAAGSWWLYSTFVAVPPSEEPIIEEEPEDTVKEQPITQEETLPEEDLDNTLLFGEPVDSDGDGLDDIREGDLGTDPNNWDTDNDELSDYDEVTIWKTDPLNSDTDGDTYLDGAEVKAGYSPTGQGRLFEPVTQQ